MKFNHVVCGGTFDHLHLGHKKLLTECFMQGERVTVGIMSRALTRHKAYQLSLQSYQTRAKSVLDLYPTFSIHKLSDIYGPTITDTTIDAICVTKDTLFGAEMINKKRREIGMKPLFIVIVPFAYDENNEKISSEHIRQGLIDREGRRYYEYLISKEKHILPDSLRGELREPLGRVFSSLSMLSHRKIVTMNDAIAQHGYFCHCCIGDMVTLMLKKRGITPGISIIDGITKRKALNERVIGLILEKDRYNAINAKGTIQKQACFMMSKLFDMGHKKAIKQLFIHGEEDLLTLVAVLLAPLGSHIWYGQQGVGAIDVLVTEKKKQTVYNLLKRFD